MRTYLWLRQDGHDELATDTEATERKLVGRGYGKVRAVWPPAYRTQRQIVNWWQDNRPALR